MMWTRHSILPWLIAALMAAPALGPATAAAQDQTRSADEVFADAQEALEHDDHQRALDLLRLAHRKDAQPRYLYHQILVLEAMGERDSAYELLEAHEPELAGQPGVGDLTALAQRLAEARSAAEGPRGAEHGPTVSASNSPLTEPDWIGWSLVGGGAALATGGVVLLVLGEGEADEIRCSGIYAGTGREGCDGIDAPATLTRAEYDERTNRMTAYRIAGASLLAVGLVGVGWGAWRLLDADELPGARVDLAPRLSDGPGASLTIDF